MKMTQNIRRENTRIKQVIIKKCSCSKRDFGSSTPVIFQSISNGVCGRGCIKYGSMTPFLDNYMAPGVLQQKTLGMTPPYRGGGFTLIELLVVVLIIGILAAVTLPQYQKLVEVSRAQQASIWLNSLKKAQAVYYMEHGQYAADYGQLDIEIPFTKQHGITQRFDDLEYRWNKWVSSPGIGICKQYAGGAYCLQADYKTGTLSCCTSTLGNATSVCRALGFTVWYGDMSLSFAGNKTFSFRCYVRSN